MKKCKHTGLCTAENKQGRCTSDRWCEYQSSSKPLKDAYTEALIQEIIAEFNLAQKHLATACFEGRAIGIKDITHAFEILVVPNEKGRIEVARLFLRMYKESNLYEWLHSREG